MADSFFSARFTPNTTSLRNTGNTTERDQTQRHQQILAEWIKIQLKQRNKMNVNNIMDTLNITHAKNSGKTTHLSSVVRKKYGSFLTKPSNECQSTQ